MSDTPAVPFPALRAAAPAATPDPPQPHQLRRHTANVSEGGLPGDRHLGSHLERARGRAAMIVVEVFAAYDAIVDQFAVT